MLSTGLSADETFGLDYRLTARTDIDDAILVNGADEVDSDADRIAERSGVSGYNEDRCRA